jgi:hypothetical protein
MTLKEQYERETGRQEPQLELSLRMVYFVSYSVWLEDKIVATMLKDSNTYFCDTNNKYCLAWRPAQCVNGPEACKHRKDEMSFLKNQTMAPAICEHGKPIGMACDKCGRGDGLKPNLTTEVKPCSRFADCAFVRIEGKCIRETCHVYDPVV